MKGVARIPGTPDEWDAWAMEGKFAKLIRLWKLRIPPKSFNVSEASLFYMLGELKAQMANGHAENLGKHFSHFFKAYASRAAAFAEQMRIDLGSTWFDKHVKPLVPPAIQSDVLEGLLFTAVTCDAND